MNNTLNYKEATDLMEKFMMDSGIRDFCTNLCKGMCCESLDKECKTKCTERNLSCGTYVCPALVHSVFNMSLAKRYYKIRQLIMPKLNELTQLFDGRCIYTDYVPIEVQKEFSISKRKFFKFFPSNTELYRVYSKIYNLKTLIERSQYLIRKETMESLTASCNKNK